MEGTINGIFNEMCAMNGQGEDPTFALKHIDEIAGPKSTQSLSRRLGVGHEYSFSMGEKQMASHLGGVRNPLVISWPRRVKDKKAPIRTPVFITSSILLPRSSKRPASKSRPIVNGRRPRNRSKGRAWFIRFDHPRRPGRARLHAVLRDVREPSPSIMTAWIRHLRPTDGSPWDGQQFPRLQSRRLAALSPRRRFQARPTTCRASFPDRLKGPFRICSGSRQRSTNVPAARRPASSKGGRPPAGASQPDRGGAHAVHVLSGARRHIPEKPSSPLHEKSRLVHDHGARRKSPKGRGRRPFLVAARRGVTAGIPALYVKRGPGPFSNTTYFTQEAGTKIARAQKKLPSRKVARSALSSKYDGWGFAPRRDGKRFS